MATVCAYIAMCILQMQTTYTWILYTSLYSYRIAVISNCVSWQLVYFRYMYHETSVVQMTKDQWDAAWEPIGVYYSYLYYVLTTECTNNCTLFQYQGWLSCMVWASDQTSADPGFIVVVGSVSNFFHQQKKIFYHFSLSHAANNNIWCTINGLLP